MRSSEQRLALDQFQKLAGPLPAAEPAPPSIPPNGLDDTGLRIAAAAAERALTHREPFPDLAEPNLVDPGRTVVQLSEQHRSLTERRARLQAEMEVNRARLAETNGVIARRLHRGERGWVQGDLSRSERDIADIDRQLPQLEGRIGAIRGDQVAMDNWCHRQADAARRWRELYDEGCARIDRRVQATGAAPTIAGHAPRPASVREQWEWWSAAVEVERSRLWEGSRPALNQAPVRSKRQGPAATSMPARPDVADVVRRVEAGEAAAERRRERQHTRARRPGGDPDHGYSTRLHDRQHAAAQQQTARGPRVSQ